MKSKFLIIIGIVFAFSAIFLILNTNIISHFVYSDQYMLETSMKSDIVQAFVKMYPANKIRYAPLEQEPVIVFEMIHDQKMAFLAVGNFQEDLVFTYKCFSYDYRTTFFALNEVFSEKQIIDNPCWDMQ